MTSKVGRAYLHAESITCQRRAGKHALRGGRLGFGVLYFEFVSSFVLRLCLGFRVSDFGLIGIWLARYAAGREPRRAVQVHSYIGESDG